MALVLPGSWRESHVSIIRFQLGLTLLLVGKLEPSIGHTQHHRAVTAGCCDFGKPHAIAGIFAELG